MLPYHVTLHPHSEGCYSTHSVIVVYIKHSLTFHRIKANQICYLGQMNVIVLSCWWWYNAHPIYNMFWGVARLGPHQTMAVTLLVTSNVSGVSLSSCLMMWWYTLWLHFVLYDSLITFLADGIALTYRVKGHAASKRFHTCSPRRSYVLERR